MMMMYYDMYSSQRSAFYIVSIYIQNNSALGLYENTISISFHDFFVSLHSHIFISGTSVEAVFFLTLYQSEKM